MVDRHCQIPTRALRGPFASPDVHGEGGVEHDHLETVLQSMKSFSLECMFATAFAATWGWPDVMFGGVAGFAARVELGPVRP